MDIFFIAPFADPEKGAAVVRANSFRDFFCSKGHSVMLLAPARNGILSTEQVFRYRGIFSLARHLFKNDFDVLIGTSPLLLDIFVSILICKIKRKPFVFDSKDLFTANQETLGLLKKNTLKFQAYRFIERFSHRQASKILVLDLQIGKVLCKDHGINPEKILLAANGVDTAVIHPVLGKRETRKQLSIPQKARLLVYMGGLGDEQYLQFLQTTAPLLKKHRTFVLFVIASDHSEMAKQQLYQIQSRVEQLGIQNRFRLVVNVPHPEIPRYLSAADAGLDFLGNFPHFPITVKILEYMACGLPAMVKSPRDSTNYGAFFSKYDTGFSASTWPEFYAQTESVLGAFSAFRKKGRKGPHIIKSGFTREITNKKVLQILEELYALR